MTLTGLRNKVVARNPTAKSTAQRPPKLAKLLNIDTTSISPDWLEMEERLAALGIVFHHVSIIISGGHGWREVRGVQYG
jgi:hypothetical protein